MVMVVRAYGRVSTDKQSLSLEAQESVCRDAFTLYQRIKPAWQDAVWGGFYREEAITRTSIFRQRPMGSLVLAATKPGDVIMAARYDRIFANVKDACDMIEIVETQKIKLNILDIDIDISGDLGQAVFKIVAVFKELAVKDIRRATREALAHLREQGRSFGQKPIGWDRVQVIVNDRKQSYLVPSDTDRGLAKRLYALHSQWEGTFKSFINELHARDIRNPYAKNKRWHQFSLRRWIDAAKNDFILPNGSHTAAPIPPNAKPVKVLTIADDD